MPIDLLFPTRRTQMFTCTIDEYIASLYDRLRDSLAITQDCAVKEAQSRNGCTTVGRGHELRPGDRILVRLDAF